MYANTHVLQFVIRRIIKEVSLYTRVLMSATLKARGGIAAEFIMRIYRMRAEVF